MTGAVNCDFWACGSRQSTLTLDAQISWQVQHFVTNLEVQISWQAQRLVTLEVQIPWLRLPRELTTMCENAHGTTTRPQSL